MMLKNAHPSLLAQPEADAARNSSDGNLNQKVRGESADGDGFHHATVSDIQLCNGSLSDSRPGSLVHEQ